MGGHNRGMRNGSRYGIECLIPNYEEWVGRSSNQRRDLRNRPDRTEWATAMKLEWQKKFEEEQAARTGSSSSGAALKDELAEVHKAQQEDKRNRNEAEDAASRDERQDHVSVRLKRQSTRLHSLVAHLGVLRRRDLPARKARDLPHQCGPPVRRSPAAG